MRERKDQNEAKLETRLRVRDRVDQLGLMDFDLCADQSRSNRLLEILSQLPDHFVDELDARLAREILPERVMIEKFAADHSITAAETRLLAGLLESVSVSEHAEAFGISINTARTHMRRLLEKTGARNQTDLVLKVFAVNKSGGH